MKTGPHEGTASPHEETKPVSSAICALHRETSLSAVPSEGIPVVSDAPEPESASAGNSRTDSEACGTMAAVPHPEKTESPASAFLIRDLLPFRCILAFRPQLQFRSFVILYLFCTVLSILYKKKRPFRLRPLRPIPRGASQEEWKGRFPGEAEKNRFIPGRFQRKESDHWEAKPY